MDVPNDEMTHILNGILVDFGRCNFFFIIICNDDEGINHNNKKNAVINA